MSDDDKINVKFSVRLECTLDQTNDPQTKQDIQFNFQFPTIKNATQTPYISEWQPPTVETNENIDESQATNSNIDPTNDPQTELPINSIKIKQNPQFSTEYELSFTKQSVIDWGKNGIITINPTLKTTVIPNSDESEASMAPAAPSKNEKKSKQASKQASKKGKGKTSTKTNDNEAIQDIKPEIIIDMSSFLTGTTEFHFTKTIKLPTINPTDNANDNLLAKPNQQTKVENSFFTLNVNISLDQALISKEWINELVPFDLELVTIESLPLPYKYDSMNETYQYKPDMFLKYKLPGMNESVQTPMYAIDYQSQLQKYQTHLKQLNQTIQSPNTNYFTTMSKFSMPETPEPISEISIAFRKVFLLAVELDNIQEFVTKITNDPIVVDIHNQDFSTRQAIKDPHSLLKEYQKSLKSDQNGENVENDPNAASPPKKGKDSKSKKKGKSSKNATSEENTIVLDDSNSTEFYIYGSSSFVLNDLFSTCLTKIKTVESCRLEQSSNVYAKFHEKIPINKVDDYNRFETQLTIKYQLLCSESKLSDILDKNKPYLRCIYYYKYDDNNVTQTLRDQIGLNNLKVLGKETEPNMKVLVNIQLTEEQMNTLDIISGFQVIDDDWRLVIIEGRKDGAAMQQIMQLLPKEQDSNRKFLVNEDISFKDRLYSEFHASLKTIKITSKMNDISQTKHVYMRSHVSYDAYKAFYKLYEITSDRCQELKMANIMHLFPTVTELLALEKQYGGYVSDQDLDGVLAKHELKVYNYPNMDQTKTSPLKRTITKATDNPFLSQNDSISEELNNMTNIQSRRSNRTNRDARRGSALSDILQEVEASKPKVIKIKKRNFVKENILRYTIPKHEILEQEQIKTQLFSTMKNSLEFDIDNNRAYYPTQKENLLIKQKYDMMNNETKGKYLRCFSEHFLDSCLMPEYEYNISKQLKIEKENKQYFYDKQNEWQYYKPTQPTEFNMHPKKPHPARCEDLTQPYDELGGSSKTGSNSTSKVDTSKLLHGIFYTQMKPITIFGMADDPTFFRSVFAMTEDEILEMERDMKDKKYNEWKRKVVVDDPVFRVYLKSSQRKNVSQIDRHEGLLHDPPKKKGLLLQSKKGKSLVLGKPCVSLSSQGKYNDSKDKRKIVRNPNQEMFIDGDFDTVTQHIVLPSVVDVLSPRSKTVEFNFRKYGS